MFLLLSTSDTDLLSARASGADFTWGNPSRLLAEDIPAMAATAELIIVRILGSRRSWESGIDAVLATGLPVVVLGGEQAPDADLMEISTVPANVAAQAHNYLAEGGSDNLRQLYNFLSDTVLLTGHGFDAPRHLPTWGHLERHSAASSDGPTVAILYYRAQHLAGNTTYIDALATAVENAGATALPIYCASLRTAEADLLDTLKSADALIVTVLAAGGTKPAGASAGGDDEAWDVAELAALDVPILQGLCLTSSRATWSENDDGLSPLDVATQVAVPEFDGRLITVPFSFKEIDDDGLTTYVPDHERAARVAGIAVRHARLRHIPAADRRIALMFSAYPTKHARIGNAVGLDTPASAIALMSDMRAAGYDLGPLDGPDSVPGLAARDGDALIHALIARGGQDPNWLTDAQLEGNPIRISAAQYGRWFEQLPADLRDGVIEHWGPAPGDLYVDRSADPNGEIVIAAMQFGNVVIMVQPPRGFGEKPVAIYHDPDLPPSHHYLAAYRWISATEADGGFGADAMVHLGKHGNLEWLPGKTLGMSASCGTDAALGDLPLIYPFLVNDPGEGTQAKRRAHATLVDHLIPPMARAESYGDISRLEQLLDEHANISALDPAKLPAIRQQIWTLMTAAQMHKDLGLEERPDEEVFDDMLLHVDGWLCEIKDVQIRDGLHILGQEPVGDAEVELVLAMLRARQMWGGEQTVPGLREALGLSEDGDEDRTRVDSIEAVAHGLVAAMQATQWDPAAAARVAGEHGGVVAQILEFAAAEVVPRLRGTSREIAQVLHALDGGFIAAGPSGSPLRGLINVLPTGRNFYSVDPKAVPSKLAWETGQAMAESLLARYRQDHGEWPKSVGLSVWGTSAMRTSGDDIAEVFALLGVSPVWDEASRRVTRLEVIDLVELGRPRIDVTVRISGFFRDAFPHVLALLDDAVRMVAALDEPADQNYVRAHAQADLAEHSDERRSTTRIFGSKPGTYGAGLLQLIDSKTWRSDDDLAQVYTTWGGFAYGRGLDGVPASDDMRTAYKRIAVAAKNTDTREHDIADSDDYFQYHGGMVATVRALTGKSPEAYIGDSTRPESVRTRTLSEETARVFRARVVNPRWLEAMRRHGYKGAFEMAATVDYLFGYDATTDVVQDWMYEKLAETYVLDEQNQKFMQQSNPWALHGIAERLLEAAERKMWAEPDKQVLDGLRKVYLETEGELEGE
ncbi:cobaltochelatase subunit CobN [Rhodococcus sp. 15-725-2-2b]|uniref:cobaltochelatase subunit CobN n=1 Tax=unclassified Rhodococcus (in: high G+C Gram-positive bacteria) TaxID=192944 RepID=UPI000B9BA778|nr:MULTISPECIES: cobaltochelatase subunit CobN [unclassified Rhodococcus (in: high G+C Gram-positive bacteria)]OZC71523.1 cobaltochelatase subunit CobN [Rhodococcus sp. 06-469-3-2]OZD42312.1 cobaltochelatase subunit CobN [Rhodococcus sp. 06-1477-1A]OZE05786.1 cobaltochelatase subunit CobN [Rhodococcus sp. 05-2255-3B1]OZE08993.1 cobaltochelatase subunit CobN [Rhodococcus sp. 05-2255-3C]OZE17940.1 cobaltochelatase subunit CobN [Rhodococcus sp. 05-2255-2A2]